MLRIRKTHTWIRRCLPENRFQQKIVSPWNWNGCSARRLHSSRTTTKQSAVSNNGGIQPDKTALLCANTGLGLMALTYLNQDILYLRLTAMSSIILSLVYQYKTKKTSLLRWNVLFLGINAAYLTTAFLHEEELQDDLENVYAMLREKGSTLEKGECKKLFELARREVRNRGDSIISQGTANEEIGFIESGSATIVTDGHVLGRIGDGHFIMDTEWFVHRNSIPMMSASDEAMDQCPKSSETEKINIAQNINEFDAGAPADIHIDSQVEDSQDEKRGTETAQVESDTMIVWLWDREHFQQLDKRITDAVLAYMAIGISRQLQQAWKEKKEDNDRMAQMQSVAVKYLFDGITRNDAK